MHHQLILPLLHGQPDARLVDILQEGVSGGGQFTSGYKFVYSRNE